MLPGVSVAIVLLKVKDTKATKAPTSWLGVAQGSIYRVLVLA